VVRLNRGKPWKELLVNVLKELGGEAHLDRIYENVLKNPRGRTLPESRKSLTATIRNALEVYSSDSEAFRKEDLFYLKEKGTGVWGLRNKQRKFLNNPKNTTNIHSDFDLNQVGDKKRISTTLAVREGQSTFRDKILHQFSSRCCVTHCIIEKALQASHIAPYTGKHSNNLANGLLLRADLHLLFDAHLWSINPDTKSVIISSKIRKTEYKKYEGKKLNIPHVSKAALEFHYRSFLNAQTH